MNSEINSPDARTVRIDRSLVLLTAIITAVIYAITLAPTVSFWDSGEYITCSWVAGVPHPPGVPLFVLMGRFSTLIFSFIPSIAQRVNMLCAIAGVFSIALVTRLVQRWAQRMGLTYSIYRPMSVFAGLLAAFSYSVWRNNNGTETYAMALLLSMTILWVFDLWLVRRLQGRPSCRQLLLVGYLITLSIANHLSALIIVGPIMLVYLHYALGKKTRAWVKPGFVLMFIGLMVLAFSIHLYLPIRSIQKPEINETNPCQWVTFRKALEREQYGQVSIFSRKGPFLDQLGLYMEYLSWQTGRPEAWNNMLGEGAGRIGTIIWIVLIAGVIYGLITLGIKRPDLLLLIGFTFLMASFFFVVYLNFKTGPEGTTLGEVRERDYFFGASFVFFAILASIGLFSAFTEFMGKARKEFLWLFLIIPAVSLAVNHHQCNRSNDYIARDYGINLLESCSEGGVLITNGDNDTFPLWFAQGVLGIRRDVIVSNLSLMNTNWYTQQLIDRDPRLLNYGEEGLVDSLRAVFIWGPNFFHVGYGGLPEHSQDDTHILRSTFSQEWPWAVVHDNFAAVIPNMGRGTQGSVAMQDLLLFNMIRCQPDHGRDIYFAGTVALDNRIYFRDYLEMEGIAFRLMDHPAVEAVNSLRGWQLVDSYLYTGMDDWNVYKGDQARQLARNYLSAFHRLAYYHISVGEPELTRLALEKAEEIMVTMPEDWMQVLPSHSLIEARLVDGLQGPEAAREALLVRADQISEYARGNGIQRLAGAVIGMTQIADEFQQEQALREVVDSIDEGSAASVCLGLEVDLAFGNFISAWNRYSELERDYPNNPITLLAHDFLEETVSTMGSHDRFNLSRSAVFTVFEFSDTEVVDRFVWKDEIQLESVLMCMIAHLADGRVLSACASGSIIAEQIDNTAERNMANDFIEWITENEETAVELSAWFLRESDRSSALSVAFQSAKTGRPALCWLALNRAEDIPVETLESLLDSPQAYIEGIPRPGSGYGRYQWVNRLIGV